MKTGIASEKQDGILFIDQSKSRSPRRRFRSSVMQRLSALKIGETHLVDASFFQTPISMLMATWNHRLSPRTFIRTDLGDDFYEITRRADRKSGRCNTSGEGQSELATFLQRIRDFLQRYIVFPADAATALALWVAHCWAIDAFDFTPYLHILSPEKRCGKSRLIDCLTLLVPRPWLVISPTAAALFRQIEADEPTLFIDEVDAVFENGKIASNQALRAVLNGGYERGRTVPRCVGQTSLQNRNVFCAKLLAGIGKLPETVADRCIPIRLVRRKPEESVEPFRKRDAEMIATPIQEKLSAWAKAEQVINELRSARPQIPRELGDRQGDICEPLFAIAEMASGDWPQHAQRALRALFSAQSEDQSVGVKLLAAIRDVFDESGDDRLPSEKLLKKLIARETDEPWAEWWERPIASGNTRGPAAKLARLLQKFDIEPRVIRLRNGSTPRGYLRQDFEDPWARYCPSEPAPDATTQHLRGAIPQ